MALRFLLLLLFFLAPSTAEIGFTTIRSDPRPIISLNEFGFTNSGAFEFNVTSLSLSNPNAAAADESKLGFFLTTRPSWLNVVQQLENSEIACPLDSNLLRIVFPLSSLREHNSSTVVFHPGAGRYSLAFANCVPGLRVSMHVSSAMYNLQRNTGSRDYLSSGTTALPVVYSLFSVIYLSIVIVVYGILMKRRSASPINLIVLALLILKSLSLLSDAEETYAINRTGLAHLHNSRLFLKFVTNMIFPRPVLTSFAWIPIDLTGPKNLILSEAAFLLCEAVLFWVLLLAMKWMELKSLRKWCSVGLSYVYCTSVVVFILEVATSYKIMWTSVALAELISLCFYVVVGYNLRHYFSHEVEEAVVEHLKPKSEKVVEHLKPKSVKVVEHLKPKSVEEVVVEYLQSNSRGLK